MRSRADVDKNDVSGVLVDFVFLIHYRSFIFTHFDSLCCTRHARRELCLGVLLDQQLFNRLTLYWSQSVRSYWLRLLVFRIGHVQGVGDDESDHSGCAGLGVGDNAEDATLTILILRTLNTHLNNIKRRHEQLEPGTVEKEQENEHGQKEDEGDDKRNSIIESSNNSPILPPSTLSSEHNNENAPPVSAQAQGLGLDLNGGSRSPPAHPPTTPPRTPKKSFSFELQSPTSSSPSSSPQRGGSGGGGSASQSKANGHKRSTDTTHTHTLSLLPKPASKLLVNVKPEYLHPHTPTHADAFDYDRSHHTYATKALSEYTNILNVEYQYQDWQSKLVPRLTVQWPAAFTFD